MFMSSKDEKILIDKPEVKYKPLSPYSVIEGDTATLMCTIIDAYPNTNITWRWIKTDSPNDALYNGPNYTIPNIEREKSGSYSCTASTTVGTSEPATINVDVQCKYKCFKACMKMRISLYDNRKHGI